jgi:hypothetical protein
MRRRLRQLRQNPPARERLRHQPRVEGLEERLALTSMPVPSGDPGPAGVFQFAPPQESAAGPAPQAPVAGDFNGDGHTDLAVSTNQDNVGGVSVLLGRGDGTFLPPTQYLVEGSAGDLAVADCNGDGRPDLVCLSWIRLGAASAIGVLLGQGDGTFEPAGPAHRSHPPFYRMAVGDFNADGRVDVVAVGAPAGLIQFLGNGNGTFREPSWTTFLPAYPTDVRAADFDGDGKADAVTTTYQLDAALNAAGSVAVLREAAAGLETVGRTPLTDGNVWQHATLTVGDFDGDTRPDVAVVASGRFHILLNRDGELTPARTFPSSVSSGAVVAADFNGDGRLDLAVGGWGNWTIPLGVWLGNGDGTFGARCEPPPVGGAWSATAGWAVAAADVNGDGLADLAAVNSESENVVIYLSQVIEAPPANPVEPPPSAEPVEPVPVGRPPFRNAEEGFLQDIYANLLRRPLDETGRDGWCLLLEQGMSRTDVVARILTSTEYRLNTIDDLYRRHLGREAEEHGRAAWLAFLEQGHTVEALEAGVLGSEEFLARYGGSDAGFLGGVYASVLGRDLDRAGAVGWGAALNEGADRAEVAAAVLGSVETRRLLVDQAYEQFLGRAPDDVGLAAFAAADAMPRESLWAAVLGSEEFSRPD